EDGIRDGHVTGVQTCALPILFAREGGAESVLQQAAGADDQRMRVDDVQQMPQLVDYTGGEFRVAKYRFDQRILAADFFRRLVFRSEERRVGKECRCELATVQ